MAGPVIFSPTPPGDLIFADFVNRAQTERYNRQIRDFQRTQERKARQRQTVGVGAGLALGAVGGLIAAPAAATAGATAKFALTGASIGAQAGGAFAGGDIAGGAAAAAQGTAGLLDMRQDIERYGYLPSKEDKLALSKVAAGLGTTPTLLFEGARAANLPVNEYVQKITTEAGMRKNMAALAQDAGMSLPEFIGLAEQEGSVFGAVRAIKAFDREQETISELDKQRRSFDQVTDMTGRGMGYVQGPTVGQQKRFGELQQAGREIEAGLRDGEISPEDAAFLYENLNQQFGELQSGYVPRTSPPSAAEQLASSSAGPPPPGAPPGSLIAHPIYDAQGNILRYALPTLDRSGAIRNEYFDPAAQPGVINVQGMNPVQVAPRSMQTVTMPDGTTILATANSEGEVTGKELKPPYDIMDVIRIAMEGARDPLGFRPLDIMEVARLVPEVQSLLSGKSPQTAQQPESLTPQQLNDRIDAFLNGVNTLPPTQAKAIADEMLKRLEELPTLTPDQFERARRLDAIAGQ